MRTGIWPSPGLNVHEWRTLSCQRAVSSKSESSAWISTRRSRQGLQWRSRNIQLDSEDCPDRFLQREDTVYATTMFFFLLLLVKVKSLSLFLITNTLRRCAILRSIQVEDMDFSQREKKTGLKCTSTSVSSYLMLMEDLQGTSSTYWKHSMLLKTNK